MDIIANDDTNNCGYGIGDITNDGNVNIIDVIALPQRIILNEFKRIQTIEVTSRVIYLFFQSKTMNLKVS